MPPIQTSGAISLQDVADEFGGSTPHSLNEYYGAAAGIPASGAISLNQFYGASAAQTITLPATTLVYLQLNLRAKAIDLGWDQSSHLEFVIPSGTVIYSDDVNVAALTTGSPFPGGLTIINNGTIMGRGGDANDTPSSDNTGTLVFGQQPDLDGNPGGPAIELNVPVTINNSGGYIGGGGGSGGGTRAGGGAGGGMGPASETYTSANTSQDNQMTVTLPQSQQAGPRAAGHQAVGTTTSHILNALVPKTIDSTGGGNGGVVGSGDFFI